MKKPALILFISVALIICLVPLAGMAAFGPSGPGANEIQSREPVLTDGDGKLNAAFLSDLAAYVADHFWLRQELIGARNTVLASALSSSGEESVILGKDGWLYYSSTLADYTGSDPMTDRELFSAANNLRLMEEYASISGADFLFTVAPNKNTVYPEHMPDTGAVSGKHDCVRLYELLESMGVPYLDLAEAIKGEDEVLYFAHDSHWNSKGAALAADRINASLGRSSDYFSDPFTDMQPHSGDIFGMLFPSVSDTEKDPVSDKKLNISYQGPSKPDSISLVVTGEGNGKLLCYRDSFGNLLHPYLAASGEWSRFSRSVNYDLTSVGPMGIDYVVIELVERNLRYLTENAPVIPAPERKGISAAEATVRAEISTEEKNDFSMAECALPTIPDDDSQVYFTAGRSIYEATLLRDNHAVAYLPLGTLPDGVVYTVNGAAVWFQAQ